MANQIVKELNVTRVEYSIIKVEEGVPSFEPQPMAVFRGALSEKRVQKSLKKQLGEEIPFVITKLDAGRHRFAMSFEDFVAHAQVIDEDDGVNSHTEDSTGNKLTGELSDA